MMPTNLLARNSTHTNFWLDSFNMLQPRSSGSSIMRSRIVIKICLIIIIICHNSECKNKMLETLRTCHNNIGKFRKHIKPLLKTNHSRNFLASGQFKQPFLTYFCLFLTNSLVKFAIFWFVLCYENLVLVAGQVEPLKIHGPSKPDPILCLIQT